MTLSARDQAIEDHLDVQAEIYQRRTAGSLQHLRHAAFRLPQGVASSFQSHYPYPFVVKYGAGQYVTDVDGNTYLDLHSGFGSNVFGHGHPLIADAIADAAGSGAHFAAPVPDLAAYADELCDRLNMDQVRLCNSGTEATMDAIRLARTFTGRDRVVKIEGGYHGHHDTVMVSVKPPVADGPPQPVPACGGIPKAVSGLVDVVAFNDVDAMAEAVARKPACVILEPVLCNLGLIIPHDGYLQAVRDLCDEHDVVLIFDQVKTAVTIAAGGAEEIWGVAPDLHCLGKAVGGGVPVGAFGGRRDIMQLISNGTAPHYGTFSGNPLVVAAGLTALRDVLTDAAYRHFDRVSDGLRSGVQQIIDRYDLPCHVRTLGAKGGIFFSSRPACDYRDWQNVTDSRLSQLAWLFMANHGVWTAPGADEQWTLPVQVTDHDAATIVSVFEEFADLAAHLPHTDH